MMSARVISVMFGALVGLLVGLGLGGLRRARKIHASRLSAGYGDTLLVALLVIAAFALGVFVAYVFLGLF